MGTSATTPPSAPLAPELPPTPLGLEPPPAAPQPARSIHGRDDLAASSPETVRNTPSAPSMSKAVAPPSSSQPVPPPRRLCGLPWAPIVPITTVPNDGEDLTNLLDEMRPRTSICPLALHDISISSSISNSWSDKDVVQFLAEIKAEDPLPPNVLDCAEFSDIDPWGSHENTWYLQRVHVRHHYENGIRKTKNGYWKPRDAFLIPVCTAIVGVKVRLDFYEGQPGSGKKTGSMMHEYHLQQNDEDNVLENKKSLCRVLIHGDERMDVEDEKFPLNEDCLHDCLTSDSHGPVEHQEPKAGPNLETLAASGRVLTYNQGQDAKKYKKTSLTKICQHKVLQISGLRQRVSGAKSRALMMMTCESLEELFYETLLDLDTVNVNITRDKNKIWRMEEKIANAHVVYLEAFTRDHGPSIQKLPETARYNGKALRCLYSYMKQLSTNPRTAAIADRLSLELNQLYKANKPANDSALILIDMLKKINIRVQDEESWVEECNVYLDSLFKKVLDASLEISRLKDEVMQLRRQIIQCLHDRANSCVLYKMTQTLEVCLTNCSWQLKASGVVHHEIKIIQSMLNDKMRYLQTFAKHQQEMSKIFKEISPALGRNQTKIDKLMKKFDLTVSESESPKEGPNSDKHAFKSIEDNAFDYCFSWRKRLFHNRHILPIVRTQYLGTCAYHATLSSTEALYKRKYAEYPTILKDKIGQPDEFLINLSRTQLEDIVEDFYRRHKPRGTEKLNVCLEKMKQEGVTSEEAYNNPHVQPDKRYRIKGYEEIDLEMKTFEEIGSELHLGQLKKQVQKIMMNPLGNNKRRKLLRREKRKLLHSIGHRVTSHLLSGKVFIANFLVTTDYHRLLPHDIYRIPERKAQYELNRKGKAWSHCVVVVGFGISNGETYLIYQNSYGTSWGDGGYGRIYFSSVKKLFLADV